ncbi:hypothetical protein GE300_22600 [Rhodobacteraceae bacterium 2CG4]|uniref:Flagellin C-terminal domain-containing protein n=1 Tax=Halovulum marinum TaxID=2662447 RepID=A0A6L5Z8W2_9RHOB|nr:flagellin [Halovulum marinum]MSU92322.1 hypothetical protein [Halovulum marinum]
MLSLPLSDLAATLRLQDQNRSVRAALDAAGKELATGQLADVRTATRGDLAPIFGIDAALQRIEVRGQGLAMAAARADAAQLALGTAQEAAGNLALDLSAAVSRGDPVSTSALQAGAAGVLETVVNLLNSSFGGRSLFSGAAQDGPALAPSQQLLDEISALVAAAPDAAAARSAIDGYFAPGGGFETGIYLGATTDAAAVELGDGARLDYLPRADDTALRDLLRGLATIAAAPEAASAADRAELIGDGAQVLLAAGDGATRMRAALGSAQQRIADAADAAEAESNALGRSRNDLVGVDQYEAATRFAALEGQLQSLYTVTARLSGLTLTNFLR